MIYLYLNKHLVKGQHKGSSGRCSEACPDRSKFVVLEANTPKSSLCSSCRSWGSSACLGFATKGFLCSIGGTGETAEHAWLSLGACPLPCGMSPEGPTSTACAVSPTGPGLKVPSSEAGVSKVPGTLLLHLFPQLSCKGVRHVVLKSGGGGWALLLK